MSNIKSYNEMEETAEHSNWFINGKSVRFKNEDEKDLSFFYNEMVCCLLAEKMEIPSIKCATINHKSDYIVEENQTFLSGYDLSSYAIPGVNTYDNYVKALMSIKNNGIYKIDIKQCTSRLLEILLFDYLTSNMNRSGGHLGFVVDSINGFKVLTPCPLICSQWTFGSDEQFSFNDSRDIAIHALSKFKFYPYYDTIGRGNNRYLKDLVKCSLSSENNKEILDRILTGLDIQGVEYQLEKMGFPLSDDQKRWYEKCIDLKKYALSQELAKQVHSENRKTDLTDTLFF